MQHVFRRGLVLACLAVLAAVVLSACGSTTSTGTSASSGNCKSPKVAMIVNSNLGDGGFWDEANAGVTEAAKEEGLCEQTIETGPDPTKWAPAVEAAANGDYDLIIAGSFEMQQLIEQAAEQNPDKQFILFDVAAECGDKCKNIYSLTLRLGENGYVAGALAALLTTDTSIPRINSANTVGFVGGQEIPVIQEYRNGFFQGVKDVDPETKILAAYAGSFSDPVKGKALASEMIGQGADVIFTASGATDKGVFEAAADGEEAWALGNAKNQALNENVVAGVEAVLTAVAGNYSSPLAGAVHEASKGTLPTGTDGSFGVKEKAIEIIESPSYKRYVPAAVRKEAAKIQEEVANGQIKVESE